MRFGGRTMAGVVVACVAWVTASLLWLFPADKPPDVVIHPVESYDSDDLARAADALEALRETRLTPAEREAVDRTADVLNDLASGDAVITPPRPVPTTVRPTTTTTTSTTTSTTTTTTTDPPRTNDVPLGDVLDDYLPPLPTLPL
jgi:hypothetical protein